MNWQDDALCAQVGGDEWFPDVGGDSRRAKRVCLACPVRVDCLEYALGDVTLMGVWGGLSENERKRLRRGAA